MSDLLGFDEVQAQRLGKLLTVHVQSQRFLLSLVGVKKIVPAVDLDYDDLPLDGFFASKSIGDDVYPVIDLASRFGPGRVEPIASSACLVVVEFESRPFALLVDAIGAVFTMDMSNITKTGVLEGGDAMPGCMGFAQFSDETYEVFDPVLLVSEKDREAVGLWRGSREAIRSLGGLKQKRQRDPLELSGDQKRLSGTYLLVRARDAIFGFPSADVIEVLPDEGVLSLPDTQPNFIGVLPLRGNCYPILDLGVYLGMKDEQRETRTRTSLLLLHDEGGPSGFRVQEIVGRFRFEGEEIDLHDSSIPIHRRFYSGTVQIEEQAVPLIDTQALLHDCSEPLLTAYEQLVEEGYTPNGEKQLVPMGP